MSAVLHASTAAPLRRDAPVPLLRTLVLCDLADSTALVERLGDLHAAELFRKHDRLARLLVHQYGGREIDKTDGFLMMFDRPIEAVAFALAYQRGLRELDTGDGEKRLRARVGIHVGDVIAWNNAPEDVAKGAKPFEIEGLVKPVTSRLMQLALPGQILLSGVAYQLAHRGQDELGDAAATALWRTHGRYRFKGLPDPVAVFEVGEKDIAPLKAPPWSSKAHREVPFWRRPATMAVEALVALALIGLPVWYLVRPEPAIAFAKRDWVVVGSLNNLTDDTSFDDSVETAFRLGLEQSRYVNVLSGLKTRGTVELMQRDPDHTEIDRTVGSEVAIRDGARALILPTVAEIGGRVRVTAEVVDPQTQTTVWSESADGVGAESVLPSLDKVNQKLRVRLGEALATVSSESQPLEKVATKNLDALRAYSLGEHAYEVDKYKDAAALYNQALRLDPDFALARVMLARVLVVSDQRDEALHQLEKAATMHDRLSPKDALYVEAWQASLGGARRAGIEKWRMLATLYPDLFAANGLYAYFAWLYENRYADDVVEAAKAAASPRNPYAPTSQLLLGIVYSGRERQDDARREFSEAEKAGMVGRFEYAIPDAVDRRFAQARNVFARRESTGVPSSDIDAYTFRVAIEIDSGHWDDAWKELDTAEHKAVEIGAQTVQSFAASRLGLDVLLKPDANPSTRIAKYIDATQALLAKSEPADRADVEFELLAAAYLAARTGSVDLAARVVAASDHALTNADHAMNAKMLLVARAEIARASGHADEAIRLLKPTIDGTELFVAHEALMNAYAAKNDHAGAESEALWLTSHRGRAYAEPNPRFVLTPYNVALSVAALLDAAEHADASGDATRARALADEFSRAWPQAADAPASFAARLRKLKTT
ncbi:MAG TPA: putative peptide modification system cyclase [Rhodanobacteraceae bacterium]|nr:putative peptide modification system cyclase [Rhodanobacteraceae bacterium]